MGEQVFPWLKSLPSAPEYHPTVTEFQDPISYIFKIEEEASRYGICKIIPPVPASSKKTVIANLNRFLSSVNRNSLPTFTTRKQQVGFSSRKHNRSVQRSVWESGETYTLLQFEAKAEKFERKLGIVKEDLTSLEIETLYWKAQAERQITVEYANDMPGSGFDETGVKQGVGESGWNCRRAARANGSVLKFLEEEIPGVTSPMVYLGMLYSWFAWHVEDHDLHSLNYLHAGAGKTWYGVPMEAAFAFEDVIRTQAFGGEMSPSVAFSTLVGKTTIVSPEVLIKAGVPCCRLVQNAGEFVVTFPRAYHCGFSHGFNCAEAVNMATPGWLRVAKEAAIRRVAVNSAPMVYVSQLLYDLARSLSSSKQKISTPEPQSSRMRERLKSKADSFVKRTFVQDVMHSNELLDALGNGSPITLLSEDVLSSLVPHGFNLNVDSSVIDRRPKRKLYSSYDHQPNKKVDPASIFSCVTCGAGCYSCVAIVQPSETAAHHFLSDEDVTVMQPIISSVCMKGNSLPESSPSALDLIASMYGDSSDSEEDFISTKFVIESNRPDNRKPSLIRPMVSSACEKDSSRLHVFCLEHAREVEQRLRSVGGVHMLLFCRQDYPEINDAARVMSKELGISEDMWTNVEYKNITEQEKMMVQWALDDEETATGNQDWAVKLGIDIFYSARLGVSPFYKEQMPYNAVIWNAFGQDSPSNQQMTIKQSVRQKKITVAGRWCGKVWMSNQVHPLLAVRDDDDNQQEDHETVSVNTVVNLKHEKQLVVRKNMRKRKKLAQQCDVNSEDESDYEPPESPKKRITRRPARKRAVRSKSKPIKNENLAKKRKKARVVATSDEEEGVFGCDIDGCDMSFRTKQDLKTHKQNICLVVGCEKQFHSHKYLGKHMRVHSDNRPLKCVWKGCNKAFKWVWARTEHMRVHTGERPYVCAEDACGRTFRFVSDFNRHRRNTGHAKKVVIKE